VRHYVPTNNLLFLKCFASTENADVLGGFIRDILGIPLAQTTVENPYDVRYVQDRLSSTTVDVLARLKDESLVTIEMQVQLQRHFAKRALYYMASRYITGYGDKRRMPEGAASDVLYASLRPIFGINVCDFNLFNDCPDPLRTFGLFDTTYKTEFIEPLFHMSFLQLRKPALKGQESLAHWLSFFKGNEPLDDAPEYIKKAYRTVAYANLSEKEREMIDYAEMSREDAKAQLEYARDEGIAQGRSMESAHIARAALLKGLNINIIRDITGLDAEAIRRLEEN
jgi:predicted transposase/invertase (TIGR01784 family)